MTPQIMAAFGAGMVVGLIIGVFPRAGWLFVLFIALVLFAATARQ